MVMFEVLKEKEMLIKDGPHYKKSNVQVFKQDDDGTYSLEIEDLTSTIVSGANFTDIQFDDFNDKESLKLYIENTEIDDMLKDFDMDIVEDYEDEILIAESIETKAREMIYDLETSIRNMGLVPFQNLEIMYIKKDMFTDVKNSKKVTTIRQLYDVMQEHFILLSVLYDDWMMDEMLKVMILSYYDVDLTFLEEEKLIMMKSMDETKELCKNGIQYEKESNIVREILAYTISA